MAFGRHFNPGQRAPNDGEYIEIGEKGTSVMNPKQVRLRKGERFPECSNHNRIWTFKG